MLRRALILSLIAAALGAAATCGVAIACAYWASPTGENPTQSGLLGDRQMPFQAARGFGVERVQSGRRTITLPNGRIPFEQSEPVEAPSWIDLVDFDSNPYRQSIEWIGAGWPVVCFRARYVFGLTSFNPLEKEWDGGFLVEQGSVFGDFSDRVIPYHPYWWGLFIDILAWGTVWFALLAMWQGGRVWRRHTRGCCLRCGYDLRGGTGNVCPECGSPCRASALTP